MKRAIFVLCITLVGIILTFVDAYFGLLLYTWFAFASPLELTYGFLSGSKLSLIVAATLVIACLQQEKILFKKHILSLFLFLFIFACFLSLLKAENFALKYVISEIELIAKIIFIAALTPALIKTPKKLRWFIFTVAVSVGVLGFYYGVFGLFAGSKSIRGQGRIGDNNGYSVFLASALPFIFYSMRHVKLPISSLVQRLSTAALLLGNVIACALTFSRGGFIALCAVIVSLLLNVKSKVTRILTWCLLLPALAAICWNIFFFDASLIQMEHAATSDSIIENTISMYKNRLRTLRSSSDEISSASSRMHFWSVAIKMFESNPAFGVGLRRYPFEYNEYDFSNGRFGENRAVHSTPLSVLAETGGFGFSIFLGIIFFALRAQSRAKKNAAKSKVPAFSKEINDYVTMLRISMLGFLIGSLFVNCLYQELLWVLISISIVIEFVSKDGSIKEEAV